MVWYRYFAEWTYMYEKIPTGQVDQSVEHFDWEMHQNSPQLIQHPCTCWYILLEIVKWFMFKIKSIEII